MGPCGTVLNRLNLGSGTRTGIVIGIGIVHDHVIVIVIVIVIAVVVAVTGGMTTAGTATGGLRDGIKGSGFRILLLRRTNMRSRGFRNSCVHACMHMCRCSHSLRS